MALEVNSKSIEYKDNKVIIKSMPKDGENFSVFIRPSDEVIFDIEGINFDQLDYALVGGDIIVKFPGQGALTFPSMGLMSFSSNPPAFNIGGKGFSIENVLSKIEEINELPITSVDASFKVRVSDTDEDRGLMHDKPDVAPQVIIVPQFQDFYDKREDFTQTEDELIKNYNDSSEVIAKNTIPNTMQNNQSSRLNDFDAYKNDFDAYKSDYDNYILKPDYEFIPKPDYEFIPKPDEEMIPDNGFTNDDDFTDYFPDPGYVNGNGNGDGQGEGIPSFGFQATAHQVRFSEVVNDDNTPEILGGGGSVLGYENDSITNQFEPETIDISNRTEDMVVKVENSDYFSNAPTATIKGVNTLTFQNLENGQSVTVDGLTLTANGAISAAEVAAGFASLAATTEAINVISVEYGTWSGNLSAGWKSGVVSEESVTFTSTAENSDISVFATSSAGSTIAVAPTAITTVSIQGVDTSTTESHALTFQDLTNGQSVTVDGLTLTASGAISADEVAAGFASLAAGSDGAVKSDTTTTNIVTNGTWSGNLSSDWNSAAASGAEVTFTSETPTLDVEDITVTSSGLTVAAPTNIVVANSENTVGVYLSKVLRFEPNTPEGFYVDSFSIEGLPSGVEILDKNANELSSPSIAREDMVFKDTDGNVIAYDSEDFLTNFKSVEFTIKYDASIEDPFNLSITANYKVDEAFADSVTESEQSFTNEYTFALKDISSAEDYTYDKADFTNALDDGFILSKEANSNIIKDGSGDNVIYGGIVKDEVYDAAGDDTYYLNDSEDTLYGGSGTNRIYADSDSGSVDAIDYDATDTISYEKVSSFGSSEIELLRSEGVISAQESQKLSGIYDADEDGDGDAQTGAGNSVDIDMLTSYKGVYVDLDGINVDGVGIDVDGDGDIDTDDKINAISKFANRNERFTYDEDGYAVSTSIGKSITFTSTSKNAEVEDILVSGVLPPPTVSSTQGTTGTTESNFLTFQDLTNGQSVTVDGLTLTASGAISADEVAAGFASLAAGSDGAVKSDTTTTNIVTNGTWSGNLSSDWNSAAASGAEVTFTSETPTLDVVDISTTSVGLITNTAGISQNTESSLLTFKALKLGESVTVDGLTLTAKTENITADNVAAGFASLAASSATGNTVTGGEWSGNLSTAWSSDNATTNNVTFTSIEENTDVTDITVSSETTDIVESSSTKQGGSDIDARQSEATTIVFKDLVVGQSVSVGGLVLKADGGNISAADVAAGFEKLSAGATAGNAVANGVWSGELVNFSSSEQEDGLDSIQATGYDIYYGVENIIGSSYNDTISGNLAIGNTLSGLGGSDTIDGRGGDNKLYGGDGSDTLISGTGKDHIDGQADTDTVSYENISDATGVTVRLDRPNDEEYDYSYLNSDLVNIKDEIFNVENVRGSNYNDIIYGNGSTNFIEGGAGDDKIIAGKGYDFIDGGEGSDWISYHDSDYPDRVNNPDFMEDITGGINVTMGADFVMLKENSSTGRLIDLVKGIEQVRGTSSSDYIRGDGSAETFWGMEGDDELRGEGGADTLDGGKGDDTLRPGRGIDTTDGGDGVDFLQLYDDGLIQYLDNTTGALFDNAQKLKIDDDGTIQYSLYDLANTSWSEWADGYKSIDGVESAINIEGLRASNGRAVNLTGNSSENILQGSSKDDIINGAGGNDIISGFQGNDILNGDDGDDIFYGSIRYDGNSDKDEHNGGEGIDTLDYGKYNHNYAMTATIVDNATTTNAGTITFAGTASNTSNYQDTFTSIERFIASRGSDTIDASATTNGMFISGMYGNDTIAGGSGNDTLYGGVNVDTINGGDGDDYINLDQRSDTDERIHAQSGEYAYGGVGGDTIISQGGRDYLYGDATDAVDAANAGRDTSTDGNDIFVVHDTPYSLHGGGGTDTLTLGDTYLDVRTTDIQDMEVLNIGDGRTYLNHSQFFTDNDFNKVTGDENSQFFIYGSNGVDDNFNFTGVDLSEFEGKFYANGYNGTDTLTLGENQSVKMDENYFSTIETFDIATGAVLNIYAQNNNSDSFYGHNKTFDDVAGEINFIGSDSNDTFYTNFEALLDGKLNVDGGSGSDEVDIRVNTTATPNGSSLTFNDADMFNNIETLDLHNISNTNSISMDAVAMDKWLGEEGEDLILDLSSNTQANNVSITNATSITNTVDHSIATTFEIGVDYHIIAQDDTSFTMHVV